MVVIGLTGGIASGKSTVSRMLRELGAEVIDSDAVAKEVIGPGTEAWKELVASFGADILLRNGQINRRKLGEMAFSDRGALRRLNEITHPRIIAAIRRRIEEAAARDVGGKGVVVIDAPLLLETGMAPLVDEVWVVTVDEGTQMSRLMRRDRLSFQEALNRLNAQMPLAEKMKYADHVIDNTGPVEQTRRCVLELWERIAKDGRGGGQGEKNR